MRYIRTKDGEIFDTEVNGAWETNNGTIGIPTIHGIVVTPKEFIIKSADTIEELCDEFVRNPLYVGESCRPFILHPTQEARYDTEQEETIYEPYINAVRRELSEQAKQFRELPKGQLEVYGAIWTNKGLIYVAKMNEKGNLELL